MKVEIAQMNSFKIKSNLIPEKLKLLIQSSYQTIIPKILAQSNRTFIRVPFKMKEKMGTEKVASFGKR